MSPCLHEHPLNCALCRLSGSISRKPNKRTEVFCPSKFREQASERARGREGGTERKKERASETQRQRDDRASERARASERVRDHTHTNTRARKKESVRASERDRDQTKTAPEVLCPSTSGKLASQTSMVMVRTPPKKVRPSWFDAADFSLTRTFVMAEL